MMNDQMAHIQHLYNQQVNNQMIIMYQQALLNQMAGLFRLCFIFCKLIFFEVVLKPELKKNLTDIKKYLGLNPKLIFK